MSDVADPPLDPRAAWGLPPLGSLPVVADLDETVTRVLGPNPSPMTLDGTNTYVIGRAGCGEAFVVDPGPEDPEHLARVEEALRVRDAEVRAVVVTHHHLDHSAAAAAWGAKFGVEVLAADARVARPARSVVTDGQLLDLAGLTVGIVATPGHTRDHVALRLETGALLTGDHVLGRGTSVVAYPDGDLAAYLGSLRKVLDLGPDVLYPGHGPALTEDPAAVLRFYAAHRQFREHQVLAELTSGPRTPRQIVERIYHDVDPRVWPAAEASTRAALAMLIERGDVLSGPDDEVRSAVAT